MIRKLVAVVALAAAGLTGAQVAAQAAGQPNRWGKADRVMWQHRAQLPLCQHEDSTDCRWDAARQGNGRGLSFVALRVTSDAVRVIYANGTVEVVRD